jgi:hypothetical protein
MRVRVGENRRSGAALRTGRPHRIMGTAERLMWSGGRPEAGGFGAFHLATWAGRRRGQDWA